MHIPYSLHLVSIAVTAAILAVLLIYVWRHRASQIAMTFLTLAVAGSVWLVSRTFLLLSPQLETKVIWLKVAYLGTAVMPPTWLLLTYQYTQKLRRTESQHLALLMLFPLVTIVLAWTNTYHGLIWRSYTLQIARGQILLRTEYGAWFWTHLIYSYLCLLTGTLLLLINLKRDPEDRPSVAILVAALIPWAADALYILRLNLLPGIDLPVIAAALSAAAVAWTILHFRFFNLLPVPTGVLFSHLHEALILLDQRCRVADTNLAAEAILGASGAELLRRPIFDLLPQQEELLRSACRERQKRAEISLASPAGTRYFDLHFSTLTSPAGKIAGYLLVLHDITARRLAEETARQREEHFLAAFESNPNGMVIIQRETGEILAANPAFAHVVECHGQSVVGRRVQNLVTWVYPEHRRSLGQALDEHGELLDLESTFLSESGERWYALLSARVIEIEGKSRVLGMVRDITLRKRAEEALRRRDTILEAMTFAVTQLMADFPLEEGFMEILRRLGHALDVSRAYIFANYSDPEGELRARQLYEWVAQDIEPQIDEPEFQSLAYTQPGQRHLYERLVQHQAFATDVDDLDEAERAVFEPQDICSLLIVPIFTGRRWWGFIGFDECLQKRTWTEMEIDTLKAAADLLGAALRRREIEEELREDERYLASLNEITQAALSNVDLPSMLQTFTEHLSALFAADDCYITLWDERQQAVIPAAASGALRHHYSDFPPERERVTLTRSVLDAGHPLPVMDVRDSPFVHPSFVQEYTDTSALALPLIAGEERLGAIIISFKERHDFTQKEIARGEQVGRQVALAIARGRLLREMQERWHEAETLREMAVTLATTLDPDEVITRILEQLKEVVPYDSASLQILRDDRLVIVGEQGYRTNVRGLAIPTEGTTPNAEVVRRRTSFRVSNAPEEYQEFDRIPHLHPVQSWLGTPMLMGQELLGIIELNKVESDFYTEEQTRLAEAFAAHAAVAITNSHLFEAERSQRELAEALAEAAAVVNSTLDLERVLDRILEQIARVLDGEAFNVMLIRDDVAVVERWRGYKRFGTEEVMRRASLKVEEVSNLRIMAESGQPRVVADVHQDPEWLPVPSQYWIRGYVGAPIEVAGLTVGFINVDASTPNRFDAEDAQRLQSFANHVATAIENAQLFLELRQYADLLEARVKERTAQMQEQYLRHSTILQSISDGVIVTDAEGQILQTNPVAAGWLTQTLSPSESERLRANVQGLARTATARPETTLELTGLDLQLRAAPIVESEDEKGGGAVIAVHDITHLRALERMKMQFVSNVSHELRTPPTTIKLYADLLQRHIDDPGRRRRYLDALRQEADRQAQLVEDILQISRIDAGRLEIHPEKVALDALTRHVVAEHRVLAQDQGIDLEHQSLTPDIRALIDPLRVRQALNNLVENALYYTPEGGRVKVRVKRTTTQGREWGVVEVQDTGIGIPEQELPHVFDRFFRGERPQEMNLPGTGLGLAIVKEIVELHGGQVMVESRVDEGTTFTLWLPLTP
ncbi:MAG: histidine kinase N-terminal 7TM domain-containing protein [Anaerolineales bacterium]